MTKLIINADDFGYSKAINYGIIETHQEGVLSSTTMMANMPGLAHAATLAKEHPNLGIGAHLVLTSGQPMLNYSHLTQSNGDFITRKQLNKQLDSLDLELVYEEWEAQIQQLQRVGIRLTHLDTHHYVHGLGELWQPMEQLAKKYQLPIRNCLNVKEHLTDTKIAPAEELWLMFIHEKMKQMTQPYSVVRDELLSIIDEEAKHYATCSVVEANCHPGFLDETIMFGSSFTHARMREVELLCDPLLKTILENHGYELVTYKDI
ncbi:carbohydrate deacetylase [Vagococcus xieshaowenii]|uniref:Carbohydrate deacetylase n=1 Tax=Vagococcus xieshaowenii TaxID=2562451 RepID=A0AAJ5EGG1_9ENTE|nr:carbohydrate deacetylase [Vagococcus xieshaowenii]QCA28427.1 carbohydrate deacetylase [Vagococcus xieshaowenii]TFZ42817.1 carbohydrate deacetylase [Vagococcus xieshaowenii]